MHRFLVVKAADGRKLIQEVHPVTGYLVALHSADLECVLDPAAVGSWTLVGPSSDDAWDLAD